MSLNNAWKSNQTTPPKPSLAQFLLEEGLRGGRWNFSITTDRHGRRTIGVLLPDQARSVEAWQEAAERHCEVMARGRPDEPTADPERTTRTLVRG